MCRRGLQYVMLALFLGGLSGFFPHPLQGAGSEQRGNLSVLYTINNYGYIEPCG